MSRKNKINYLNNLYIYIYIYIEGPVLRNILKSQLRLESFVEGTE